MNNYLTIITTALVVTQIIRLIQNTIQLSRDNKLIKKQLGQISDITDEDLQRQKAVYRMLHEYLSKKIEEVTE